MPSPLPSTTSITSTPDPTPSPTLNEAIADSETLANPPPPLRTHTPRNPLNLTVETATPGSSNEASARRESPTDPAIAPHGGAPDEANRSETSSIIPTSARLSIATTHFSHHVPPEAHDGGRTDPVGTLLDSILAQPGWNVARRRGNSLFSMRSHAPTLPPYSFEDHRPMGQAPLQQQRLGEAGRSTGVGAVANAAEGALGSDKRSLRDEKADRNADDFHGGGGNSNNDNNATRPNADEGDAFADAAHPILPRPRSLPLAADDEHAEAENALTAHYSRIVRTIDSRYTTELERLRQEVTDLRRAHVEELAVVRNDMDAAYRTVLKKRDREVEKARARSEELEEGMESWKEGLRKGAEEERERSVEEQAKKLERERNMVEDVWVRRWKDKMGLMEEEVDRRVRGRDEEWLRFLDENLPEIVQSARDLMIPIVENPEGDFAVDADGVSKECEGQNSVADIGAAVSGRGR